jgi:succinate dehydrogenase / fumarate reductase flavoprotein subunit
LTRNDNRKPEDIPEEERDYYLERKYPSYGNLAPRDIASRAAKERIDAGNGVGPLKNAVYLDFKDALANQGKATIAKKYGNLFDMYQKITGINAYNEPMKISPAAHFSMGGLWVDYELSTNIPGLFAIGEANFSDHGANRLGANSLLQACVDGYYILPQTLPHYLAQSGNPEAINKEDPAFIECEQQVTKQLEDLGKINGNKTVDYFHRELGKILYDKCGLSRNEKGLIIAIEAIRNLKASFYNDLKIPSKINGINEELEKAGRVADYLEIGELMCIDALSREESCGAHFRTEFQTNDGEAIRNDEEFKFISCWKKSDNVPLLIKEMLNFEFTKPTERSYK